MNNFNSDAKQDEFVANMLQFKKNGYCLDIGSHHSMKSNNTYFFTQLDWSSITVEIDSSYNNTYDRKNGIHINQNALSVDYKTILLKNQFPKLIDYLSLDVDTISTDVLKIIPFSDFTFKIITIEHDAYIYGDTYRMEQRKILNSLGYFLICSNVYVEQSGFEGKECSFEDWWIYPSSFDESLINKIKCDSTLPSNIISKF